jgi:hypothetical protein
METNQGVPPALRTPTNLPPLHLIRNNPRLAKEGFKTFQGLASDECNMLVESINTILYNPKHVMSKYIGQTNNIAKCQEEAKETQLTVEELRILLSKITCS